MVSKFFTLCLVLCAGAVAQASSQLWDKAFEENRSAHTYQDVSIKSYSCEMDVVEAHSGKCEIRFVYQGAEMVRLASPEVAAPWSTSYGPIEARPMSHLSFVISANSEIIRIRDQEGRTVSNKIDYSR